MGLSLEDFDEIAVPQPAATPDVVPRPQAEADKATSYEQGYQAGWDDAARAEAEDQDRIGAEFARNLQELAFTFYEARAHVIQAMEPLLGELLDTILPEIARETLGLKIVEVLTPLIEEAADQPVELVVSPQSRPAIERHLGDLTATPLVLVEETSLADGQAFLRVGRTEQKIDMTGALDQIRDAVASLHALNEGALKHA